LGLAVQGFMPTASQLTKIGMMQLAGCWHCTRVRASAHDLAIETYSHINCAVCKGIATTVSLSTTVFGACDICMAAYMMHKSSGENKRTIGRPKVNQ